MCVGGQTVIRALTVYVSKYSKLSPGKFNFFQSIRSLNWGCRGDLHVKCKVGRMGGVTPTAARDGLAAPPGAQALTFGLLQQGGDAVGEHGRLAQLHQGQEEGLQRGVQGLQQGEAQAQALDGHACGHEARSGRVSARRGCDPVRGQRGRPLRLGRATGGRRFKRDQGEAQVGQRGAWLLRNPRPPAHLWGLARTAPCIVFNLLIWK